MKKRTKIRIIVGLVVFGATVFGVNHYLSTKQGAMKKTEDNPTYPVIQMTSASGDYNTMPAYNAEIDLSLVRNQVTAFDSDRKLNFKLYCRDYDITAVQYAIFGTSSDKPIEEGTVNQFTEDQKEGTKSGEITVTGSLGEEKSYYLRMAVRLSRDTRVYFYTKIQSANGYHFEDYMTFARTFHNDLFDRENIDKCATYLEPSVASTDKQLDTVTINSTINSVFYGDLTMKQECEPWVKVKELNKTYAVVELKSVASYREEEDGPKKYFNITEVFKMRYTASRMFLLDYQREMGEIYDGTHLDPQQNYLGLGIQSEDRISYSFTPNGHQVCFVNEGELWYYNYDETSASRIYSLSVGEFDDVHNGVGGQEIKIFGRKDNGDIIYAICGYMNRGSYEGKNGIAIMTYHPHQNYSDEVAFLGTSVSYDVMKRDLDKCSYLNSSNMLYCLLDGDLHEVNLNRKTDNILASGIINESLTVSQNQKLIALEEQRDLTKNRVINIINLENQNKVSIEADADQRVRSAGFIEKDFIYLVAQEENVRQEANGVLNFFAVQAVIIDEQANVIKTFDKGGDSFISRAKVEGSVLTLKLAKKNGDTFQRPYKTEHIRYKQDEKVKSVSLTKAFSSKYWNQLFFKFPDKVYIQVAPKILTATMEIAPETTMVNLQKSGTKVKRYFVYAKGQLREEFTNFPESIKSADSERGNVIDVNENILWQCAFPQYAIVEGMSEVDEPVSEKESLEVCLHMVSQVTGENIDDLNVDTKEKTIEQLIEEHTNGQALNLTGVTVENAFYYISIGSPVIARIGPQKYVILMSYNQSKVRYIDPVTGESKAVKHSEMKEMLKKYGTQMYSYIR